ncbi:MAG: hypothetical protein R3C01_07485 [Planctomycetaceae bacterium]
MRAKVMLLVMLVSLAGTFGLLFHGAQSSAQVLEASGKLKWYRGNMHTHSLWSDGDDFLETIAVWYRDRDYDFLCFTDHNVLADSDKWVDTERNAGGKKAFDKLEALFPDWVETRKSGDRTQVRLRRFTEVAEKLNDPGKFLLIQGEEITDSYDHRPIHMNANNLVERITPRGGGNVLETMQNNVNAVIAQREKTGQPMLIHLNHPNFGYAITAEELMQVQGEQFFEVYNGHTSVNNHGDKRHASTERIWDIVLTKRLAELGLPLMYGLAADDGHRYHNIPSRASEPGRGWVHVLSTELTPAALIEAMEAGRFYSSSGVRLKRVESSPQGLSLEVDPVKGEEYVIEFVGTRRGYKPKGKPVRGVDGKLLHTTMTYDDSIGEVFATVNGTSASYQFQGDEIYVRARITSSAEHLNPSAEGDFQQAWCQPVIGPATKVLPEVK